MAGSDGETRLLEESQEEAPSFGWHVLVVLLR